MSVDGLSRIQTIIEKLRALLKKALVVKQSTSIDPPLPPDEFESDIINIAPIPPPASSDGNARPSPIVASQHAAFETAVRHIFYVQLAACVADEVDFVELCNLLDILQFCADHKQCDPNLPWWLVEELLDSQTIDGCKRVFDFLESRRQRMITNDFNTNKRLVVLRSCNEVLRRLSRAEDAVFCGRVFMFLFQSFPLGDKSSVNLRGEFHVENTTTFDAPRQEQEANIKEEGDTEMDMDGVAPLGQTSAQQDGRIDAPATNRTTAKPGDAVPSIAVAVDGRNKDSEPDTDTLYAMFWSLQSVFSNPKELFAAEKFEAFKKGIEATIKKFKSVPKVVQTRGTPRTPSNGVPQGVKRKRDDRNGDAFASNFNPKYLTSRDLFELEISDLTFQRYILVQTLIVIDFLLSQTPKAKKKTEGKFQNALNYPFTPSPEDTTWATTTRTTVSSYLQDGPEGKFYHRMVETVLSRDKNWVRWKIENCPPISLPPVQTASYASAMSAAKRFCTPKRLRATPLGSLDLSFLTEDAAAPGGGAAAAEARLALLRDPARYTQPEVEPYVRAAQAIDLDMEMLRPQEESAAAKEATAVAKEESAEKKVKSAAEKMQEQKTAAVRHEYEAAKEEHEAAKEELAALRKEQAPIRGEWQKLVDARAGNTWRALRLTARRRIGLLDVVDEAKDLSALLPRAVELAELESEEDAAGVVKGDESAIDADAAAPGSDDDDNADGDVEMPAGTSNDAIASPTADAAPTIEPPIPAITISTHDDGDLDPEGEGDAAAPAPRADDMDDDAAAADTDTQSTTRHAPSSSFSSTTTAASAPAEDLSEAQPGHPIGADADADAEQQDADVEMGVDEGAEGAGIRSGAEKAAEGVLEAAVEGDSDA